MRLAQNYTMPLTDVKNALHQYLRQSCLNSKKWTEGFRAQRQMRADAWIARYGPMRDGGMIPEVFDKPVRTPGTAGRRRRSGSSRAHDLTSCGSPAGGGSAPVTAATAHAAVLAGRANDTANAEAQAFSLPVPDAQLLATIEAACASIPGATETVEDRGKGQETSAEAGQSVPRSEGSVGTPTRVVRRDGHLAKRAAKPSKQAARSRSKKPKALAMAEAAALEVSTGRPRRDAGVPERLRNDLGALPLATSGHRGRAQLHCT